MKAKLIVEGKEFDIEINNPELEKLVKPPKRTGYERLESTESYWAVDGFGVCKHVCEEENVINEIYDNANYYSDLTVAENNARADRLMRQLRRFAVEHREKDIDWKENVNKKWHIAYSYDNASLCIDTAHCLRHCGMIYFDSRKTCDLAIETFHDELIWYFTEYKDSL